MQSTSAFLVAVQASDSPAMVQEFNEARITQYLELLANTVLQVIVSGCK